jgi:hypothetical protein
MRRRLLLAVSVGLTAAASLAATAAPASADAPVCVVTRHGAVLWPPHRHHCHSCCCRRRSERDQPPGLAFRAIGQRDEYLRVRRWGAGGWMHASQVRLAPEAACRHAGI